MKQEGLEFYSDILTELDIAERTQVHVFANKSRRKCFVSFKMIKRQQTIAITFCFFFWGSDITLNHYYYKFRGQKEFDDNNFDITL